MKKQSDQKTIVCFGDSNTYGYDPRDLFGRPYTETWTDILNKESGYHIVNCGQPGREIPSYDLQYEILGREMNRILSETDQLEYLFLMLGTNDILNMYRPVVATVVQRMEKLLDFLTEATEGHRECKLCLLIPPEVQMEDTYRLAMEELQQAYRSLAARRQLEVLDTSQWGLQLAFDGIHISEQSQRLFAEKIMTYLSEQ